MKTIQKKLTLVIFVIVITAGGLYLSIAYYNFRTQLNDYNAQILTLAADNARTEFNSNFRAMEDAVYSIYDYAYDRIDTYPDFLTDSNIRRSLTNNVSLLAKSVAENTEGAMSVYLKYNPDIFGPTAGFWYVHDSDDDRWEFKLLTDMSLYEKEDVEHVGWYYVPIESGKAIWMDPYYNQNIGVKMISFVIPFYYNGQEVGVIGMDLNVDILKSMAAELDSYEGRSVFVADKDGDIIYSQNYENGEVFENLPEDFKAIFDNMKNSETEIVTYTWNDIERKVVVSKLRNGMILGTYIRTDVINRPQVALLRQYIILFVITVIFALVLGTIFVRSLVKPLKELTNAANELAQGDLDVKINVQSNDEIGILAESFRKTAASLKKNIEYINKQANTDALTGLNNKSSYNETEAAINKEIILGDVAFTITILDINGLKPINDTYGHEAGDQLISVVAGAIKGVYGDRMSFRIGGDEFACIIRNSSLEDANERASKMGKALQAHNERHSNDMLGNVSVAIGTAEFDKLSDHNLADVFRRADANMYECKKNQKINQGR